MQIKGLQTVIYKVPDLNKAKAWYSVALGVLPYFDEPYYVGFNVGGYELGLDPDMTDVKTGSNVIVYWGVANAFHAFQELLQKGATAHEEVKDVGSGILVGTVNDPFGNIFGVIENPHFTGETK